MSVDRHPIVVFLDKKRFTALEICQAAKINATSLTNLINKSGVELCSKRTNRGVSREFPLVDVYILSMVNSVLKIVKDYKAASEIVNCLFYEMPRQMLMAGKMSWRNDSEMKASFSNSIFNAVPELYQRDLSDPWVLISKCDGEEVKSYHASNVRNAISILGDGAFVMSVTRFLSDLDESLAIRSGFDMKDHLEKQARKAVLAGFKKGLDKVIERKKPGQDLEKEDDTDD